MDKRRVDLLPSFAQFCGVLEEMSGGRGRCDWVCWSLTLVADWRDSLLRFTRSNSREVTSARGFSNANFCSPEKLQPASATCLPSAYVQVVHALVLSIRRVQLMPPTRSATHVKKIKIRNGYTMNYVCFFNCVDWWYMITAHHSRLHQCSPWR